jgi:hypothetical protein
MHVTPLNGGSRGGVRVPLKVGVSPLGRKLDTPTYAVKRELFFGALRIRIVIVPLPSNEILMFILNINFRPRGHCVSNSVVYE